MIQQYFFVQVTSSPAVLRCEYPGNPIDCLQQHHNNVNKAAAAAAAAASSSDAAAVASSEAAVEPEVGDEVKEGQMYSLNSEAGNNSDESGMGEELAQESATANEIGTFF